jgi:hypothetical protein
MGISFRDTKESPGGNQNKGCVNISAEMLKTTTELLINNRIGAVLKGRRNETVKRLLRMAKEIVGLPESVKE